MASHPRENLLDCYERLRNELLRFLIARTGDVDAAEEVLQDLWLRAQRHSRADVANGRAYLYRVAHNLVLDRARDRQRRMLRERQWIDLKPGGALISDVTYEAENALIDKEEIGRLKAGIAAMPPRAREAFELHKLAGRSHAEIAEQLGISRSAVEKHMAVALRYLRRALLD